MKSNLIKKLKNNEGITLVALVVTIIVLLILAGVSFGLVFNSEGLFSKANEAASRYNQAKENELAFLQGADEYFDRYNGVWEGGTGTTEDYQTYHLFEVDIVVTSQMSHQLANAYLMEVKLPIALDRGQHLE